MKRIAAFAATALVCLGIGVHSQTLPPPVRPVANAAQIEYDNTTSGLSATQVQAALDEIKGTGGGASHIIKDEGTARPTRAGLNFIGAGVECLDDAGNSETDCTFTGGGGGITGLTADAGGTTAGTSITLSGGTNGIDTSRSVDTITFLFDATEVGTDAFTDAQISNTLTASLFVGSGSTTSAIDLATAEAAGLLTVAKGGTGATPTVDNQAFVSTGSGAAGWTGAIPNCTDGTHYLDFDGTNFVCVAITGGSGTALQSADTPVNDIRYDNTANLWYEDRATTGSFQPGEELELGPSQERTIVTATANLAGNTSVLDGDDITQAVANCGTDACEVRLLQGTYIDVCEMWGNKTNLRIIGKGRGKTIFKPVTDLDNCDDGGAESGIFEEPYGPAMIQVYGMKNFEIAYIEVDGDKEIQVAPDTAQPFANYAGTFLRFDHLADAPSFNSWVHHLYIHDIVGSGIYMVNGDRWVVEDNDIENIGCNVDAALNAWNLCGCTGDPGTCRGWTAYGEPEPGNKSNANGINMEGGATYNAIIQRNTVSHTTKIGIEVTGAVLPCGAADHCGEGHQVLDNTLVGAPIILNGSQRSVVARNRISDQSGRGRGGDYGSGLMLVASSVESALIENNVITGMDGSGMVIKPVGPGDVTLRGNRLENNCLVHDVGANLMIRTSSASPARNILVEGNTAIGSAGCPYALRADDLGGGGVLGWDGSLIFRGGTYATGSAGTVLLDDGFFEVKGLNVTGTMTFGANAHGIALENTGSITNTGGLCVLNDTSTPIPATCISGSTSGGGWGVASNVVSLSATGDEVVVGGAAALSGSKLSVDADVDQILLTLQAHSAQTAPLLVLENSIGTDVFSVDVNGQVTMAAHPTNGGAVLLKEGVDDGTDAFTLKVQDAGLTAPVTCTIGADGLIPATCVSGGGGITYTDTLANDPALNAEECVFTVDGAGGGGLLCEGTVANTNEQIWLFPNSDGANTTAFIATDDSFSFTNLDGIGLAHSGGALNVSSNELDFIFHTNSATPTQNGAMVIDDNGDATNWVAPVLAFQSTSDYLIFPAHAYPTTDGQILAFEADTDTLEWVTPSAVAGGWTVAANVITETVTTDDVVIGGSGAINGAKFTVEGDEDEPLLWLQGNGTQTGNVVTVEQNGGIDLLTLNNAGDLTVLGSITAGASATPTLVFDDTGGATGTAESQIVADAVADNNGQISLQVEVADNSYVEGLMTKSTGGVVSGVQSGKVDRNNITLTDNDCTGEQGWWWYDTTESRFEFCDANSGAPGVLGAGTTEVDDDGAGEQFQTGWDGDATHAPSKDDVYDWGHIFDTDDDGQVNTIDDGSVVEADLAAADFGEFTCGAGAGDCTVDDGISVNFTDGSIATIDLATETRSMHWGAGSWSVDGTNCATAGQVEVAMPTGGPKLWSVTCAVNAASRAWGSTRMPTGWDEAGVTFSVGAFNATSETLTCNVDITCQCVTDGEAANTTFTTEGAGTEVSLGFTTLANQTQWVEQGAPITCTGTCADNDRLTWQLEVETTGTSANCGTNVKFTDVRMEYVSNVGDN